MIKEEFFVFVNKHKQLKTTIKYTKLIIKFIKSFRTKINK